MTIETYNQNRGIPMGAQSLSSGGGGGTGGASINDNQVSTTTAYSSNKVESRLAEKTGAGLSLGFNATLANEILTFVTTDETPYTLKENYDYEIDLHFPAAGTLSDTIKMVVENNNDTIQFVALTHADPSEPITVGTMKQLMYYDAETGFRWLFKARYKTTSTGVKVFVIYPVISKDSATIATTTAAGIVKPDGTTVTVTEDGTISSAYKLPIASSTTLGGVKIENNKGLLINSSSGSLSVSSTIPNKTTFSNGINCGGTNSFTTVNPVTVGGAGSSGKGTLRVKTGDYESYVKMGYDSTGRGTFKGIMTHTSSQALTTYGIYSSGAQGVDIFEVKGYVGVNITPQVGNTSITASTLSIKPNSLTFTKSDSTVVDLLDKSGGGAAASDNGIRADYASTYGILDAPNGIISDALVDGAVVLTLHQGLVLQCAGQEAKTVIAADTTHTVESTTDFDLFYASGSFYEAAEVVFSETEPTGSNTGITAWFNPNKTANPDQKWQFKSNTNGNTWAASPATRLAHIHIEGTNLTRIDYAGCRVLDGQHFLTPAEAVHAAMPSTDKYIDLTLGASGTTYTAPADGYVYFQRYGSAQNTVVNAYCSFKISSLENPTIIIESRASQADWTKDTYGLMNAFFAIRKGATFIFNYRDFSDVKADSCFFRFIYAVGSEPTE